MACQTHYVGDVRYVFYYSCYVQYFIIVCDNFRAINNELIDSYQLKSLDGIFGT